MGLGHKYITKEIDLSQFASVINTRPLSIDKDVAELKDYFQEYLKVNGWDEYSAYLVRSGAESLAKYIVVNSNYHRYEVDVQEKVISDKREVHVYIHLYLHPLLSAKETLFMELL